MDAPNIRQCEVDRIKRHDQVLGIVNLLKGSYNARLSSDRPSKVFVGNSILKTHALFSYQRELVFVDRGQVIAVVAEVAEECKCFAISCRCLYLQSFQPAIHLVCVLVGPLLRNCTLDDCIAISSQVVPPVSERRIRAVHSHALIFDGLQRNRRCLRCGGDHVDAYIGLGAVCRIG